MNRSISAGAAGKDRSAGSEAPADRTVVVFLRHSAGSGGGADSVLLNTVMALDRSRFFPVVVFLRKHREPPSVHVPYLLAQQIPCFDLPGSRMFDLKQFRELSAIARRHRADIIHSNDPKSNVNSILLRTFLPGLKTVSTVHGWIRRRPRSALYMRVDLWALKRFDAVIAVSRNIADMAEARGVGNLHVIHNSIDPDAWVPASREQPSAGIQDIPRPFRVGFIGRISAEKGPLDFVAAAAKIVAAHPSCKFLVAGEGPLEGQMREKVRQNKLEECFTFLGPLMQSQLIDVYRELDLLLLPSYTEGLPMVVLEAFAMAIPVVATQVGGVAEVISHGINGYLAEPGDSTALAGFAVRIIQNSEIRTALRDHARRTIEDHFSRKAAVGRLQDIYRRVMHRQ